jgi:hypothetical protein
MSRSFVSNLTHTGQQIQKVQVEIHLYPVVKYGCHWANVHDTHACLSTFSKEFLHWFHENIVADIMSQTDGWMAAWTWPPCTTFFFFISYKCLKLVAKLVKELLVYSQLTKVAFIWVWSQLLPMAWKLKTKLFHWSGAWLWGMLKIYQWTASNLIAVLLHHNRP